MARAVIVGVVGAVAAAAALFDGGGSSEKPASTRKGVATEWGDRASKSTETGTPIRHEQLAIDRDANAVGESGGRPVRDVFSAQRSQPDRPNKPAAVGIQDGERFSVPEIEFLGRFSTDDSHQAMVVTAGQSALIKVGDLVEGSFTVRAIEDDYLILVHAASGAELKVARGSGRK